MSLKTEGPAQGKEEVVTTACCSHCGGSCLLKIHVRDGVIERIETDEGEEPQLRACVRGRAYRQRVYDDHRVKYPMKRIGVRGEGKFERISWDEALDTVARELKRVYSTYGPEAILLQFAGGDLPLLHGFPSTDKLLCRTGGYTRHWGIFSCEGSFFSDLAMFGTLETTNRRDDLLNSKLIIMWGWNPAVTIGCTNTSWYLKQAKEKGIRMISVDPRYTESAIAFADWWIPVRPGTDAAMMIAMAYVIIKENLHDQRFLDTYTIGFDRYRDYVMGLEDGVAKTPRWAEAISGVPAETIERLAREFAATKPAALLAGMAPGRSAYGEEYHRAATVLQAMTGNIGVHGGWSGCEHRFAIRAQTAARAGNPNPVDAKAPIPKDLLPLRPSSIRGAGRVNLHRTADAILRGKAGGYPADYKMTWVVCHNVINQLCNTNKMARAFQKLEFVVVQEQHMTPTAKFADILLPACTCYERNDVTYGASLPEFYGYFRKVIDPLFESRSHLDIAKAMAERMGISDYAKQTEDSLLRQIVKNAFGIEDYDAFKEKGFQKIEMAGPEVAFKNEIENPDKYRFNTPSGKIEIYSQLVADIGNPLLPPIPKYIETWESRNDPLAAKYPLQLISGHSKRRSHTQYESLPWLREVETQSVEINAVDARARGISDGDMVRVFNDRGQVEIPARVTERIMPGVADVGEGAWFAPDAKGIDRGGCPNVLTRDEPSPGGAMPSNTALVQVEKAQ